MAIEGPITGSVVADASVTTAKIASNAVTTVKIANDAVTYAKLQNTAATDVLLGRSTAGAGDVEEIACTAAGRALLDDVAASNQRTTLGLGTAAVVDTGTGSGNVPTIAQADARYAAVGAGTVRYQPAVVWTRDNVAINLTDATMLLVGITGFATWMATAAGNIVGIVAMFNDVITAGTLTLTIGINGSPSSGSGLYSSTVNPGGGVSTLTVGDATVAAGDLVGLTITTSALLVPIASMEIRVWIVFQES